MPPAHGAGFPRGLCKDRDGVLVYISHQHRFGPLGMPPWAHGPAQVASPGAHAMLSPGSTPGFGNGSSPAKKGKRVEEGRSALCLHHLAFIITPEVQVFALGV